MASVDARIVASRASLALITASSSVRRRTVLLLGGSGFLGTHLARALRKTGHRVVLTSRGTRARDGYPALSLPLTDTASLIDLIEAEKIDIVVHLACGLLPSSTEGAYIEELARVTVPTILLARRLADRGLPFTFLSSGGTVYGASAVSRVTEDEPCRPISLYGQAKVELEQHLVFLARTSGLRLLILRPSNPYGPYQSLHGPQGLVSVLLGRIVEERPLDVWGDGSIVRDYIHVEDAADAMAGLIERDATGTFNIGSGVGHSLIDVVRTVETVTGRSVTLNFHPARAIDVPRLVLDPTRLADEGWARAAPLVDGVRSYAQTLGLAIARP